MLYQFLTSSILIYYVSTHPCMHTDTYSDKWR